MSLTKKILIVDDDPDDIYLTKRALESTEYCLTYMFAENGQQMLNLLTNSEDDNNLPDLIVLDLNMPEMDGKSALESISKVDPPVKCPIIVFSTSASNTDIEDAYRLGAKTFVKKPGSYSELAAVMKKLCHYWFHIVRSAD